MAKKRVTKSDLGGIGCLLFSNLNEDYTFNEVAARKQIDWVIDHGATSLWIRGTLGEWPLLGVDVTKQMFKTYADYASGRALVAAGCSASRPSEAIELVNYADTVGCDLAWICPLTPPNPSMEGIYRYYEVIAENTSLPLAIYNGGLGVHMTAQWVLDIANISDKFVAFKDSMGDFPHQCELYRLGVHKKAASFAVTRVMMPSLILGCAGLLPVPYQVPMAVAAYEAFKKGDLATGWKYQLKMCGDRGLEPGVPMPPSAQGKLKNELYLGFEFGPPALPHAVANANDRKEVEAEIAKWKILDLDAPFPKVEMRESRIANTLTEA